MPPNPSLRQKSAARMAAVQCLYRQAMTQEKITPEKQVAQLKAQFKDNRAEQKLLIGEPIEPNYRLVETLLAGVASRQADIDAAIDGRLTGGWTRARMSTLLVAALQCAVFELLFHKEISAKIIIDEYTRLARHFFGDDDVNFLHGVLSALALKSPRPLGT